MKPAGAFGLSLPAQPMALDTFNVGISVVVGSGNCGLGPTLACGGSLEDSPHAVSNAAAVIKSASRRETVMVRTSQWPSVGQFRNRQNPVEYRGADSFQTPRPPQINFA
ncbi:hypothetical protein D3C84_753740 [compost metagenome]